MKFERPLADFQKHIEAALVYAGHSHSFDDVVAMVADGKAQPWFGPDSIVITEIVEAPRRTLLNIFIAGGHLKEIEAMFPKILEWGRAQGCTGAMSVGRRGWERTFLTRTGWKAERILYTTELE